MQTKIVDHMKQHPKKRFTIKMLFDELGQNKSDHYKIIAKAVNELDHDARIIADTQNAYRLIEHTNYRRGTLDLNHRGFGFLLIEDLDEDDIYIPKSNVKGAMDKDRVLAYVKTSKKGLLKEGDITRILSRHRTMLIGTLIKRGKTYLLKSDDESIREAIIIPPSAKLHATINDKVQVKITRYAYKGVIEAKVTNVLGKLDQKGVDILSKILTHGIDPAFSDTVMNAADHLNLNIDSKRADLRDRPIFTLDGADAKDYDDALDLTYHEDQTMTLSVHIADVSYYVQAASVLDKEAYRRGTSIYLVDRVIPMLPEKLSNELCSLVPNKDRLAITLEMTLNPSGDVLSQKLFPSIINSKARLTYQAVNAYFTHKNIIKGLDKALHHSLDQLNTLAKTLHKKRHKQGSIDFETEESLITLNEHGKAVDVKTNTRGDAEKMIEECMLLANRHVATLFKQKKLPCIYRVHDAPKEEKLEKLIAMSHALGLEIKETPHITQSYLQKLLQKVKDTASEKGLNLLMLRSMQKAIYSEKNIGHFGLGFNNYTHFTSPIRRYPDLMVHRLIRHYFINHNPKKISEQTLKQTANDASLKERQAIALERDVTDMKKAEYMAKHLHKPFEGTISSVTAFGLYVSLPNTIEGLIHISDLDDDYYQFNEDLLTLSGKHHKTTYRIGDQVTIKATEVNIPDGEIDFKLIRR